MNYFVIFVFVMFLTFIISGQVVNANSSEAKLEPRPQYIVGKITRLVTLDELKEVVFEGQNVDKNQIWTDGSVVFKDFSWIKNQNTIVFTLNHLNSTFVLDPKTKKLSIEKSGILDTRHPPNQLDNMLVLVDQSEKGRPQNLMSLTRTDGISRQIIFIGPPNPVSPAISSDGRFIVFGSDPDIYKTKEAGGIYLMELDKVLLPEKQCKEGLEIVFKPSNKSPACVKPETKIKLLERGWINTDYFTVNLGGGNDPDIIQDQLENKIITHDDNDRLVNITNDQAKQIIFDEGNWNSSMLKDKELKTYLLHVKNDGFAFVVDENSLKDKELFMEKFPDISKNQYLWIVTISLNGGSNREWHYMINASDGSIIKSMEETMNLFEPIDPSESIKNQITVRQATGDVTIIFPKGVAKAIPKYSPFPVQLLISQGDTVTWTNEDSIPHTVSSVSETGRIGKSFDSGLVSPGQSFSYIFKEQQVYQYACLIHPWMGGGIVVQNLER